MPEGLPVTPAEGVLAYKLALAILSVLQEKGVLSDAEVDRVLRAAKLSATQGQATVRPAATGAKKAAGETPSAPMLDLDLSGDQPG